MKSKLSIGVLVALSFVVFVAIRAGGEGGGEADESTCTQAGLEGEAFGLCRAFCDALDCTQADGDQGAACEAVRGRYLEATGASALPCEQKTCKCWDPEVVFERIESVNDPEFVCYSDLDPEGMFSFVEYVLEDASGEPVFGISLEDQQDHWSCLYFDGFDVGDPSGERDDLTAADVQDCRDAFEPPFVCTP